MKRFWICAVTFVLIACMIPCVSAQETETRLVSETLEYLDDGSYIVTTIHEEIPLIVPAATGYTKTGSKTISGKTSDGTVCWTFTLTGTFVVNEGVMSACTTARYSYTVPVSSWSLKSGSAAKTGNQAVGSATFIKKVLGVTVETDDVSCTLTCNKYGVLS